MSANQASIEAVIGASGSGKSLYIKTQRIKRSDRRLLVWDRMKEYKGIVEKSTDNIAEIVRALRGESFRIAFQPSYDAAISARQFDIFCRAAYAAQNLKMIAEELSFVTSPARSPAGWRMVTCTGRHVGLQVIGTSQRPTQIDKDFFGNCTEIHCGRLNYKNDQRTMADVLGVENSDILGLEPLQYIHKNMANGEIVAGRIKRPK